MNISSLAVAEVAQRLRQGGLGLKTGPFTFRIHSPVGGLAEGISLLYADYPLLPQDAFADFVVTLEPGKGLHRWLRPQVNFTYDGAKPFEPLPVDHAYPLLEWAMNWCISTQAHQYLMLHSAVIERNGCAVIMPAPPGSGKSTLCSGLISRGWRLLSDELALISLADGSLTPLCRPVSLKNESIRIIGAYAPGAVFNAVTHNTTKGSVTHMRVDQHHLAAITQPARPRWVIFPKYVAAAQARLTPRGRGSSLLELGRNSFNYMVLGLAGFEALSRVVSVSDCYDFEYSQLDDAVAVFDGLAAHAAQEPSA